MRKVSAFLIAWLLFFGVTNTVYAEDIRHEFEQSDSVLTVDNQTFVVDDGAYEEISEIIERADSYHVTQNDDYIFLSAETLIDSYAEPNGYCENMELTMVTLTASIDSCYTSVSGAAYGIASSCTLYYTKRMDAPYPLDPSPEFNFSSISVIYTNLPSASTSINSIDVTVRMTNLASESSYFYSTHFSSPSPNVTYNRTINSGYYNMLGYYPYLEMQVYYANGHSSIWSKEFFSHQ